MKQVLIGLFFLALVVGIFGQQGPKFDGPEKWHMIAVYEKAIRSQEKAVTDAAEFNALAESERVKAGYPVGTRFDVRPETGDVLVVIPAKVEEPVKKESK